MVVYGLMNRTGLPAGSPVSFLEGSFRIGSRRSYPYQGTSTLFNRALAVLACAGLSLNVGPAGGFTIFPAEIP